MGDSLSQAAIDAAVETAWLGRPALYLSAVGSTNEVLAALAAAGAPTGTAVVADYQVRGRGRQNRRWLAPAGTSLLLSLLLRPNWAPEQSQWLTMIAGVAVVKAVADVAGMALGLKWPNDIVRDRPDGMRKLGGVLIEAQIQEDRLSQAIVGIGLNVNVPLDSLPSGPVQPSSLLVESGMPIPRTPLLAAVLRHFETVYDRAGAGQSPQPTWEERLVLRNRPVTVAGNETFAGVVLGTDDWGRLQVRDKNGQVHTLSAGDVTLRPAGGAG